MTFNPLSNTTPSSLLMGAELIGADLLKELATTNRGQQLSPSGQNDSLNPNTGANSAGTIQSAAGLASLGADFMNAGLDLLKLANTDQSANQGSGALTNNPLGSGTSSEVPLLLNVITDLLKVLENSANSNPQSSDTGTDPIMRDLLKLLENSDNSNPESSEAADEPSADDSEPDDSDDADAGNDPYSAVVPPSLARTESPSTSNGTPTPPAPIGTPSTNGWTPALEAETGNQLEKQGYSITK